MANETVTIDIDTDGNVQIEGHGFSDAECSTVTKALEEALGEVKKVVKKPEAYRQRAQGQKKGVRG